MEVRTLEALFSLKFDSAQLQHAIKSVDGFADNVNQMMTGLADKMPLNIIVKLDSAKAKQAKKEVDDFSSTVKKAINGVVGYFAIQSMTNFFNTTVEGMANLGRTAGYLGISTSALQEFRYAAQKSGVSVDTLDDSLKELQIRAVDALSGSGEAFDAFNKVGVNTKDAFGNIRKPLDLLNEVSDKLNSLSTQSERIWVVDSMFGDQGAEMLKILSGGSLGLDNMRKEANQLGFVLNDSEIAKAKQFQESMTQLKVKLDGVIRPIVLALLPGLHDFADKTSSVSSQLAILFEKTTLLRAILMGLAAILGVIAIQSVIAFAPFFGLSLLIALLVLVIDDLWNAFTGGESVLLKLHKKAREFFGPIEQDLLNLPKAFLNFLTNGISKGLDWIKSQMFAFKEWIFDVADSIKDRLAGLLDNLIPDFVKKGFSAAIDYVGDIGSKYDQPSQSHLAPQIATSAKQIQNNHSQSVNVAVNVKSGAAPQEIGSEVQKAVRKELEKERTNAFMGVNNYAY